MEKMLKIICLVLISVVCVSCHAVPTGLYKNKKFVLTDENCKSIISSLAAIDETTFYMTRSDNTDMNNSSHEEIYISNDDVVWYLSDAQKEQAYTNGCFYTRYAGEEISTKKKSDFSTEKYYEYSKYSSQLLKEMFSTSSSNFTMEASYSLVIDNEDYITIVLDYKENADGIGTMVPGFSNTGARIEFNYSEQEDLYFNFHISWNTDLYSYYVIFEPKTVPEDLMCNVESVIQPIDY